MGKEIREAGLGPQRQGAAHALAARAGPHCGPPSRPDDLYLRRVISGASFAPKHTYQSETRSVAPYRVSAAAQPIADKLMVVVARQGHDANSTKSKSGSRPRPAKTGSAKASSAKAAQKKAASTSSDSDDGSAPKRRRRIGTRDPNKPSPKAWSEEEVEAFKQLIDADGPGSW